MAKYRRVTTNNDMKDLVSILSNGGIFSVDNLSNEMNRTKEYIRRLVAKIRRKFNDGDKEFDAWVFSTKGGYTMDEKPEHAVYEARMRIQMGMGVIMNGAYVIKTMKRIAVNDFNSLMVTYRPQMIQMGKFIK